jgi:hypothetical protein
MPHAKPAPFIAKLRATTHRPKAGRAWPIVVRATTRAGKPLAATSRIRFLFGGRVVGRGATAHFVGVHRETVTWPRRSAGFPLTFRVVVTTSRGTRNLDYPVEVRR